MLKKPICILYYIFKSACLKKKIFKKIFYFNFREYFEKMLRMLKETKYRPSKEKASQRSQKMLWAVGKLCMTLCEMKKLKMDIK